MKRHVLLALIPIALTISGCSGDGEPVGTVGPTTTTAPCCAEAAQTSEKPAAEIPDPVYLENPLSYWVEQAGAAEPEDRDKTVEALALALSDEAPEIRVAAADALASFGPDAEAAAEALAGQLGHLSPWVRVAAMETLTGIGARAVPVLIDTFQNGVGGERIRAALVIGAIGTDAQQAVGVFEQAIQDESEDEGMRSRVASILALIDPNAQPATDGAGGALATFDPTMATTETRIAPLGQPGDWPQFHGPRRDAMSAETGLLKEWPEDGPELSWQLNGLGRGYSTVAISEGKILTMGDRTPEGRDESQFVVAYDLATREELWATRVGPPHENGGPRCTPTVDGEVLYVLGTDGDLLCVETETGTILWQKNLQKDFDGQMMSRWKYSESPLIDGDKLICTPGGNEAAIVALDKTNGRVIWASVLPDFGADGKDAAGKDGAGYSSPVVAEIAGVRQYVQMCGRGTVGVDAASGRFLWGYNRIANTIANITMPVVRGDYVFVTTAYGTGAALLKITRDGDTFAAEEVYFLGGKQFENQHGGVILLGDHLYGGSGSNKGEPTCLELSTGKIAWSEKAPERGSAAVVYADGHLIFRYDRGLVALIEATPEAYRLKSSFTPIMADGPGWAHPVVHNGRLYLRHDDLLLCYDLRANGS
ncbi:MAG: PQQ-binding-like beta-propeller repeat protein [Thermoguttaceae bacterium]